MKWESIQYLADKEGVDQSTLVGDKLARLKRSWDANNDDGFSLKHLVKIGGGWNKLGIVSNGYIRVALLILNLCARQEWVVKTTLGPLFCLERSQVRIYMKLGEPQNDLDGCGEEKVFFFKKGSESRAFKLLACRYTDPRIRYQLVGVGGMKVYQT